MNWPIVSIVIPAFNALSRYTALLESIQGLDYPDDCIETLLVDDCSTDGTAEAVAADYPAVRVVRNSTNLKFAATANRGVREASGEFILFLNDDTRIEESALKHLVEAIQSEAGCCAVGARIVDWDGIRILFNGGYVNFTGKAFEEQWPVESPEAKQCRTYQLFACGGAMLVRRHEFLELGGFDEDYGFYFEDVDFGWRANLCGATIRFVSKAIVYHAAHSSLESFDYGWRSRFYERNSLWTIYKNLDDSSLSRALPAALLLSAERARILAKPNIALQDKGLRNRVLQNVEGLLRSSSRAIPVASEGIEHLEALSGFAEDASVLLEKRRQVQSRRTVHDNQLLQSDLFPAPFRLWAYNDEHYAALRTGGYEEYRAKVIELFGVAELFGKKFSKISA